MKPLFYHTKLYDQKTKNTYKILDVLGRGASTIVYQAECLFPDGTKDMRVLKEYAPNCIPITRNPEGALLVPPAFLDTFQKGTKDFLASAKRERELRTLPRVQNETAPFLESFRDKGTVYLSVLPFFGTTLNRLASKDLLMQMKLLRSLARLLSAFHEAGILCLDLKPENIFVLADSEGKPVTELVHLIDFDSFQILEELQNGTALSFSEDWAAPEQKDPAGRGDISFSTDCYLFGEILFVTLFGRHSDSSEHRLQSRFPASRWLKEYQDLPNRHQVEREVTELLHHTLRSHVKNRYSSMEDVRKAMDRIVSALEEQENLLLKLPCLSSRVVGRMEEGEKFEELLQSNSQLYVSGPAGIGKTTFVLDHLNKRKKGTLLYFSYTEDILTTLASDSYTRILPFQQEKDETTGEYALRKLRHLTRLTENKETICVLDNVPANLLLGEELPKEWKTVLLSRTAPPSSLCPTLALKPIGEDASLQEIFERALGRKLNTEETEQFPTLLFTLGRNTLLVKLSAASMEAGHHTMEEFLGKMETLGLGAFKEPVFLDYDGAQKPAAPDAILSGLLLEEGLSLEEKALLQGLSYLPSVPLSLQHVKVLFGLSDFTLLNRLIASGKVDLSGDMISMHPLVRETMRSLPVTEETKTVVRGLSQNLSRKLSSSEDLLASGTLKNARDLVNFSHAFSQVLTRLDEFQKDEVFLSFQAELYKILPLEFQEEVLEVTGTLLKNPVLSAEKKVDLYDRRVEILSTGHRLFEAGEELKEAYVFLAPYRSPSFLGRFYDTLTGFFDERLGGAYAYGDLSKAERADYKRYLTCTEKAMNHLKKSTKPEDRRLYLEMILARLNRMARTEPRKKKELLKLFRMAEDELRGMRPLSFKLMGHFEMSRFWYETFSAGNEERAFLHLKRAEAYYERVLATPKERIDTLLIPKADALLTFGRKQASLAVLKEAVALCNDMGDCAPYLKLKTELMQYMLDVYVEAEDGQKARSLLKEIDSFFPAYSRYGIVHPVSEEERIWIEAL